MVGGTNRLVAMVTLVAVLASGLAVSPLPHVESAAADQPGIPPLIGSTAPCVDVVFVGAQGSGQTYSDNNGMGPEVWLGMTSYARHMGGYSLAYFPVPYPSAGVATLLTARTRGVFFDSINQGVTDTLRFLKNRHEKCARFGEHYVLAGYSQGAMVMHRVINRLNDRTSELHRTWGSRLLPRIDGVLAIADGDRSGPQGGISYDTARREGAGVTWGASALGVAVGTDRPQRSIPNSSAWPSTRFHSVCAKGDLVCDFSTAGAPKPYSAQILLSLKRGAELHGNYYKPGGESDVFVRSAAANIAKTSKALNPPEPLATVSMRVGQTDQLILVDDGQYIDTVQWVGAPVPGAVLSPGEPTMPATMTWKPTAVAVYPYTIRVRYDNGTMQDITGTVRAVAVPPRSIVYEQSSAVYREAGVGPYPQGQPTVLVTFTLTRSATSAVTPTRITDREDPASDFFMLISGDTNRNNLLDLGEAWTYHGVISWWPWETSDTLVRTLLISANDRSGAKEWLELVRPITLSR